MILIKNKYYPHLEYLTANNIHTNDVTAIFTTRNGGVSGEAIGSKYLHSLNLQLNSTHDTQENIVENYHIIASALGYKTDNIMAVQQIHTDNIIAIDKKMLEDCATIQNNQKPHQPPTPHILGEADALITNQKGFLLSVRTADCVPILLYDKTNRVIGAVHAGWRGTFMQIASKTIKRMGELYGSNPSDIQVTIGPTIGLCCYEVDEKFHEKFCHEYGEKINNHFRLQPNEKPYCDLKAMNKAFLCEAGIPEINIEISDLCTMCHPELFYSHRLSGEKRGTMAAFIGLK